jgi:hypothetical protein
MVLLAVPPKCWDFGCAPPCLASISFLLYPANCECYIVEFLDILIFLKKNLILF